MNFEEIYGLEIIKAFNESPIKGIDDSVFSQFSDKLDKIIFLQIYSKLCEQWKSYSKHGIVVLIELEKLYSKNINFNIEQIFHGEIKAILKTSKRLISMTATLNEDISITNKNQYASNDNLLNESIISSTKNKSIIFIMHQEGTEAIINGIHIIKSKCDNIYEAIARNRFFSISEYKDLLTGFFEAYIKFDKTKRYFLKNVTCPNEWKSIVDENPFVLINKPESKIQIDLNTYLRNHCSDTVLRETKNDEEDIYDIWVSDSNQKIYVIEIKWLGKSITGSGKFTTYGESRAIEGAYQLNYYLESMEKNDFGRIHMGILLVIDARSTTENINYPCELTSKINLDLDNHLRLEPKIVPASSAYQNS